MAALAAISSATPSLQNTLTRSRLEAARREADQAQAYADQLGAQVEQQQKVVEQSQQRVRTLEQKSNASSGSSPSASSSSAAPPQQENPTYMKALAGVFQPTKPVLSSSLSPVQKSLSKTTRLEASQTSGQLTPVFGIFFGQKKLENTKKTGPPIWGYIFAEPNVFYLCGPQVVSVKPPDTAAWHQYRGI